MSYVVFLTVLLWLGQAEAGGLTTPFGINTTQVLPKGVRSLNVSGVNTTVDTWHNDVGLVTGVAEPFNQKLSYARLLQAESDNNLKLNVESQLRNKGVDLSSTAGEAFADVNTRVFATIAALAYGFTEKLTVAIAVPILYTNMQVGTGFVGSPELQQLVADFSKQSRKQTRLIQEKLSDVIATEIRGKGYKPMTNQEQTQVGDLRVVAKYLGYKNLYYSWGLINTFTFPTAQVRDIAKVIDPTPGDGQFDYGVASIVEVPLNSQWRVISDTGYTIQFADTRATRIPHSVNERLSRDVDPGASRDLGDLMYTSLAGLYSPMDYLSFGGSYTLAYKERDQWRGSLASADRYKVLGVETEQYMQALYLQAVASSVQAYRNKDFPVPMMATLGYGYILDGRNVRNDPVWSLNMMMFF